LENVDTQTVDTFGLNAFRITSIGRIFCEAVMANNDSVEPQASCNMVEPADNILRSSEESFRALFAALDLGWQIN
jgi:hypothetical protein